MRKSNSKKIIIAVLAAAAVFIAWKKGLIAKILHHG